MFTLKCAAEEYDKEQFQNCIAALSPDHTITEENDIELLDFIPRLRDFELLQRRGSIEVGQLLSVARNDKSTRYCVLVMDQVVPIVGSKGAVYERRIHEAYQIFFLNRESDLPKRSRITNSGRRPLLPCCCLARDGQTRYSDPDHAV